MKHFTVLKPLFRKLLTGKYYRQENESPTIVCNSIGGVGSSFLFDFLYNNLDNVSANHFPPGYSHWKHSLYPPLTPGIRKAIFVYGRPRDAILSIYRREIQSIHLMNKGLPAPDHSLEEYLACGRDIFRTAEHIHNWTSNPTPYPIFCIKYEVIHNHISDILDFFEIDPLNATQLPPRRERKSSTWSNTLPQHQRDQLDGILEASNQLYESLDDVQILSAD